MVVHEDGQSLMYRRLARAEEHNQHSSLHYNDTISYISNGRLRAAMGDKVEP